MRGNVLDFVNPSPYIDLPAVDPVVTTSRRLNHAYSHERFNPSSSNFVEQTLNFFSLHESDILLEVGCGLGNELCYMAGECATNAIGADNNIYRVNEAAGKCHLISGVCAEALNLPFKDKSIDKIFTYDTLEHIELRDRAVSEIMRVLKTDGRLVIKTPKRESIENNLWMIAKVLRLFFKNKGGILSKPGNLLSNYNAYYGHVAAGLGERDFTEIAARYGFAVSFSYFLNTRKEKAAWVVNETLPNSPRVRKVFESIFSLVDLLRPSPFSGGLAVIAYFDRPP